ncbi:MAG: hypothetical protein A2X64_04010 [Ignavibacteria bacterium GWF2_33_9]|nr:MAG: hypothetical protein A2X64_04010 [Ignavibacteria bacterium GWF2_33_9]
MNAVYILLFVTAWLIFAYFWWGRVISNKVLKITNNPTPSHTLKDDRDFSPTKPQILFGHHFSSIAGAGPIVGPIIAYALFGWLPALIWIIVGSVFMGAVHDYTALIVSTRNNGKSIVEISETVISPRARNIFGIFVWLTMVLIQAVFADLTAKTFVDQPEIALPTIGLLILALIFGLLVYKMGANLTIASIIGLILIALLLWFGKSVPIYLSYDIWLILIIFYAFLASVLPVWLLLQPRDYLSMYILIVGLIAGFIGMIFLAPQITGPTFVSFSSKSGPLFPILFITVACGAISGFHSIVSSGTTAKQMDKEKDGQKIAMGGMLTEAILAALVLLMISSVLVWDPKLTSGSEFSFQKILSGSANKVFGIAIGRTLEAIGVPLFLGIQFGIIMLNSFLLTTFDTSARLNRYIMQETLGVKYGGIFKNIYFATGSSLILAYIFCLSGGYRELWPIFGSSNQLIGTLALFVISSYLFGNKSPHWYTLLPGFILLAITGTALLYQAIFVFIPQRNIFLLIVSLVLLSLAIVVAYESIKKIFSKNKLANE